MKIFNKTEAWSDKVNFVDENNVLVGYDLSQNCCEIADWFISDRVCRDTLNGEQPKDLEGYTFDTNFFESVDEVKEEGRDWNTLDSGGMVVFRLVHATEPDKYLHLYNCHNGYYGHGFSFNKGDQEIESGCL